MRFASLVGVVAIVATGCGSSFESGAGASATGTSSATTTSTGAGGGATTTSTGAGGGSVTTPTGAGGSTGTITGAGGATATSSAPCDGVPGGLEHDGRCYVLIGGEEGIDFATARAACEALTSSSTGREGHLVHVNGVDEEVWIEQMVAPLAGPSDVLVGLRCPDGTPVASCVMPGLGADRGNFVPNWRWVDDDAPCTYSDWAPPGPTFMASGDDPDLAEDARCAAIHLGDPLPDPAWQVRPCSAPAWPRGDRGGPATPMRALCEIE